MVVEPAPWQLEGRGFVLVFPTTRRGAIRRGWADRGSESAYRGGPAILMLVDYADSAVGPYRELLFTPGRFRGAGPIAFTVTRIAVSSVASALSGRVNWGLPKVAAQFAIAPQGEAERWTVRRDDELLAGMDVEAYGPTVPVPSFIGKLTIVQEGRLVTHITAEGAIRLASARAKSIPWVPGLDARPAIAFAVPRFRMVFPRAEIVDEHGHEVAPTTAPA